MNKPILYIIVPAYNEAMVLPYTIKRLSKISQELINSNKIQKNSFILFVDDGSNDKTWDIVKENSNHNPFIKGIKLSKNVGHQKALWAGMEYVKDRCDCVVTIDADLQDDENAIIVMVEKYLENFDIVYGVKEKRDSDTFFKKFTAESFYKLMKILGVDIIFNHADFRLLSRRSLFNLLQYSERNLFLRGLVPIISNNFTIVKDNIKERLAGKSKYPIKKMLSFAFDGITSFSIKPIRIITIIGFLIFLFSSIMGIYTLYLSIFTNKTIPGWASTVLPIYFIGGVQILFLGIVGEYIGKIYIEVKNRPHYFIEEEIQ